MTQSLSSQRQQKLERFVARLGIENTERVRWDLLHLALTHPSIDSVHNYEQLEFLGDSVVRLVASQEMWFKDHDSKVGEWSSVRSVLVSDRTLAEIAKSFGLEQFLRVGASTVGDRKGETSRLADAFEAVLGALFLSQQNLALVLPWLEPIFWRYIQRIKTDPAYKNYKAELQQLTQSIHKVLPEYRTQPLREGKEQMRDPLFQSEVWLLGNCHGTGQGRSRKEAEKAAARVAYDALVHLGKA